jgi:hypothetical protein
MGTLDEGPTVIKIILRASRVVAQGSENENANPAEQESVQPTSPPLLAPEPDCEKERNDPKKDEQKGLIGT